MNYATTSIERASQAAATRGLVEVCKSRLMAHYAMSRGMEADTASDAVLVAERLSELLVGLEREARASYTQEDQRQVIVEQFQAGGFRGQRMSGCTASLRFET